MREMKIYGGGEKQMVEGSIGLVFKGFIKNGCKLVSLGVRRKMEW
jgi:hypothetical protein